ncbi:MAG: ATP-binding protein [Chitinophagaceae bacterium]|nr:ATP-binding protein [Chitinophagaceae bacterium]
MLKKIVIIGPESTGKSSLCKKLAEYFKTVHVDEFARQYLIANGTDYTYGELLTIAKGQINLEEEVIGTLITDYRLPTTEKPRIPNSKPQTSNSKLQTSNPKPLFIDTDMYVMKVWCEFVFNKCHQWILDKIVERQYDLYLLCDIDLPWVKDELREYPDIESRKKLYDYYEDALINQAVPWVKISGNYEERFLTAIKAVSVLLQK